MKIAASSDFAYRLLIYAATHSDRLITAKEVADAYGLSLNHIAKISKLLIQNGILQGQRGRGGGIRLAKEPDTIRLGDILDITEPHPTVIDCTNGISGPCILLPACTLKHILAEARQAFFNTLNKYTLHDIATKPELQKALKTLLTPKE